MDFWNLIKMTDRGQGIMAGTEARTDNGSDTGNEKCVDHYLFSAFIIYSMRSGQCFFFVERTCVRSGQRLVTAGGERWAGRGRGVSLLLTAS